MALDLVTEHLLTVRGPTDGSCIVSTVGLYGTEPIAAVASSDGQLYLHRPFCKTHEAKWRAPHCGRVEQLAFSPCSPLQLVSVSLDCLLLWQIENNLPLPPGPGGAPPSFKLALPPLESLGCVCFSPSSQHLVLCDGAQVLVWETQSCQLEATLHAHSSPITHATFHPHHSHTLITTSQDRTFTVWDLATASLVHQSSIMSSAPLTHAVVDADNDVLAIAAANGKLWLLDASPSGGYKSLLECDVWRERDRFLAHTHGGGEGGGGEGRREEQGARVEAGTAVLGLHYWTSISSTREAANSPISMNPLREPRSLLIVGHSAVVIFDPNTLQVLSYLDFRDPIPSSECPLHSATPLPVTGSCTLTTCPSDDQVYCVLHGMFEVAVSLLTFSVNTTPKVSCDSRMGDRPLSLLSSDPLVPNSLLRSEFMPKPHPPSTKPGVAGKRKAGRKPINDKPLTFKNKVRSSGYTAAPRMKMFTPNTAAVSSKLPPKSPHLTTFHGRPGGEVYRTAEQSGVVPTSLHRTLQPLGATPGPLSPLSFSGDGHYVSCGASDGAVYLVKMPVPSEKKITTLTGHNGTIHSMDWSHSGEWVLSGSADRTARLWTPAQKDPLLTLAHVKSSSKIKTCANTTTSAEEQFPAAVSHAVFYYLDKFFLFSSSNCLYLYKYHVDPHPTDDIKRYRNLNGYKLVQSLPMHGMQTITALACVNNFLSHLVLVGGSNKSVDVFDMNVGQRVRSMSECHTRPPHCVALNKGSRGVGQVANWTYDLFLTAAPVDGIKLWDLRTNRCVRHLSAHVNRCHAVHAQFSPCSRYMATGSEDRAAYMYDLRSLSPLHKLSGHSDVVTSLAFHPLTPTLATATLDGKISIFTSETP